MGRAEPLSGGWQAFDLSNSKGLKFELVLVVWVEASGLVGAIGHLAERPECPGAVGGKRPKGQNIQAEGPGRLSSPLGLLGGRLPAHPAVFWRRRREASALTAQWRGWRLSMCEGMEHWPRVAPGLFSQRHPLQIALHKSHSWLKPTIASCVVPTLSESLSRNHSARVEPLLFFSGIGKTLAATSNEV